MGVALSMSEPGSSSPSPAPDNKPSPDVEGEQRRIWTTDELLAGEREVLIRHGDDLYRLRITRHGKLILYK